MSTSTPPSYSITKRASNTRGYSDHGWLKTYHTFSFANYHDPNHTQFGPLRVINEDWVSPGSGFPPHPHSHFEIFSYVVHGALDHKDSTGTHETIGRGEIQFTTAGTGIAHSEYNASSKTPVHFLQIWVSPDHKSLPPAYATGSFPESAKVNSLCLMIKPAHGRESAKRLANTEPIEVHTDMFVYSSILDPKKCVELKINGDRQVYVHVVQRKTDNGDAESVQPELEVNGVALAGGDGAAIRGLGADVKFVNSGDGRVEFLVFDMRADE